GLSPDVVLLHPTEPTPGQRGDIGAYDGFKANVTGFREQDGTEADGQVRHPGITFDDMREGMRKPRARMDFQEELGQINPGQALEHGVTQPEQALGLLQLVEPSEG